MSFPEVQEYRKSLSSEWTHFLLTHLKTVVELLVYKPLVIMVADDEGCFFHVTIFQRPDD